MRLRDIAKGTTAVRVVKLALVNAAQPEQASSGESVREIKLGVRVLTGAETLDVLDKAQRASALAQVPKWDPEHPICKLHEMVQTILLACVSVNQETDEAELRPDGEPVPFFSSSEEILGSTLIGSDNIVYLHEQQVHWQDALSPLRFQKMTFDHAVALIAQDMDRKEGELGPLVGMSHATLVSCVRTLGDRLLPLLMGRSVSTELIDTGTGGTSKTPSGGMADPAETLTTTSEP